MGPLGHLQAAQSYPGILTGRRTFENFWNIDFADHEFLSEFCHFLIFPIDSYSSVCTGMSSVTVCLSLFDFHNDSYSSVCTGGNFSFPPTLPSFILLLLFR